MAVSEKDLANIEEVEDEAKLPVSAIQEINPGFLDRPQSGLSRGSRRSSTWSSGKRQQAPSAPLTSSHRSLSVSRASSVSSCCEGKRHSGTLKERISRVCDDPKQRKQILLWLGFFLLAFFTVVIVSVMVSRFTSGFVGGPELGQGEDWSDSNSPAVRPSSRVSSKNKWHLLLIAGNDEERFDSNEILTDSEPCHMVMGFPKPLPDGRTGHVVAVTSPQTLTVCGGRSKESKEVIRTCWQYTPLTNNWMEVPGLRIPVMNAAAAMIRQSMFVMGGLDPKGAKTDAVQVMDTNTYTWSQGPSLPQPVWGHCAVNSGAAIIITGGWYLSAVKFNMASTFELRPKTEHEVKKWITLPHMQHGRATHGCHATVYKDGMQVVIVAGGMDSNNKPVASVEILVLSDNPHWLHLGNLIKPRAWFPGVAVLRNRLLVMAGQSQEKLENSIERFNIGKKKFEIIDQELQWHRKDFRTAVVPSSWFPSCNN